MPSMNPMRRQLNADAAPIPFSDPKPLSLRAAPGHAVNLRHMPESIDDVLAAFDTMSRRITDLARELNCLGHFDDPNGDLPRAA